MSRATVVLATAFVLVAGSGAGRAQGPGIVRLVDDHGPVLSPDGKTIVFERYFSTLRRGIDTHPVPKRAVLVVMRADGSGKRVLRRSSATFETDASFSPDGRSLLFVRDERIYRMRRDGRGARPVRRDVLDQACPRFSPDGRKISFWRGRTAKSGAYFVMNSDGTGLRRIMAIGREAPWGCPSWFPDSRKVVLAKDYSLYVVSVDGRSSKRITRDRDDTLYRPSVSRDGGWIACDGYIDGPRFGYGIIVMRADGTGTRRITTGGDYLNDSTPSWSPDGGRIVFSGYRGRYESAGVYIISRNGKGLRRLSNFRRRR